MLRWPGGWEGRHSMGHKRQPTWTSRGAMPMIFLRRGGQGAPSPPGTKVMLVPTVIFSPYRVGMVAFSDCSGRVANTLFTRAPNKLSTARGSCCASLLVPAARKPGGNMHIQPASSRSRITPTTAAAVQLIPSARPRASCARLPQTKTQMQERNADAAAGAPHQACQQHWLGQVGGVCNVEAQNVLQLRPGNEQSSGIGEVGSRRACWSLLTPMAAATQPVRWCKFGGGQKGKRLAAPSGGAARTARCVFSGMESQRAQAAPRCL